MPYNYIDSLLNSLNEAEKKSINHSLFSQKPPEVVLKRKFISQIIGLSSEKIPVNRMLKSRAFDDVLDVLISNYHLNKKNFSAHDQTLFKLKKKILFARVLSKNIDQNRTRPFKTFLNIIITEAEKNEVYEVLIEALLIKKYFFALKENHKNFEKISQKINHFELCQKRIYFSSDCYYNIVINSNFLKFKNDKSFHSYIVASIRIIKADYQKYKSAQINYYLQIIIMYYYERQKKYLLAAKYCKMLFNLIKEKPVIYRKERLGFSLINLSQYKTFTENFNEAVKYAKMAQTYYLPNSNNYLMSKEQEFNIYFYNRKYTKAQDCLKELLNHKLIDSSNFNQSKYVYYQSVLYFEQNKCKQALSLLNRSLEIEKDKTRWNISLRILYIMIFIEMNKINEAFSSLESLRKYIERTGKSREISTRDILIVKLLREMEKSGFEYTPENKVTEKMIQKLSEKDSETSWEYFSSELIPIHKWIKNRKKN